VEKGWMPPNRQIGLTGKNVSPKLLITMGISGSVQFVAGIENSKMILAVNSDPDANIFTLSDYSICYDMYEIMDYAEEKFKEE
jgi:electron transfer flavoprotein alpha subunit